MNLDAIGFGSLNLDEFWEVDSMFLDVHGLQTGEEFVRDVEWFNRVYPVLVDRAELKARDPGGSAANTIAALRKMGFDTGFFGAGGRADQASLRPAELGDPGNLRILQSDLPAGRCLSLIVKDDPGRDRALVILPNANDLAGSLGFDLDYFIGAAWVHLTSFVSLVPLAAQIKLVEALAGRTGISFDPGALYCSLGFGPLEAILRRADLLFASGEELTGLTGNDDIDAAVSTLLDLGVGTVVLKHGSSGISAFQAGKHLHQPAVAPARILDRTGAGDVAAAGFLAGMLESLSIEESLELAAVAASRSIEGYGRSCYPDRQLLEHFLKESGKR